MATIDDLVTDVPLSSPSTSDFPTSELELAYLAGIFDGEGCITIQRWTTTQRRTATYAISLIVANTNEDVVRRFHRRFGGWVVTKKGHARWKTVWRWIHYGRPAIAVSAQLRPYLRIKAPQAVLAEEFLETFARDAARGRRLTDEQQAERARIREAMTQLNRRGPNGDN